MTRRTRLRIAALAAAALLGGWAAACGDGGEDGGAERAGTTRADLLLSFPKSIGWAPLLVAEERGWFREEGVAVATHETEGSGFVTQQVIAGNRDFGWAGGDSIVVAAGKAPGVRAVACNQSQNIFRIVTPADSRVRSVADLAGGTLGFTESGGGEEPLVRSALAEAGIAGDVELLPIGAAGPQAKAAIASGVVDAYATSYPDVATLTADGLALRDVTPDRYSRTPGDCLVVMEDTLADPQKRRAVVAIGRAWARGAVFTIANPARALAIACREVPEECRDDAFARAYMAQTAKLLVPLDRDVPPAGLDVEGWRTTAEVLRSSGTIDGEVDVEQIVDSPEVREVAAAIQDFDADAVRAEATGAR